MSDPSVCGETRIPRDMCEGNTHPWETHIPVTPEQNFHYSTMKIFLMAFQSLPTSSRTEAETKALLSVWGSEQIQSELDGVVRNKNIYERISN